MNNAKLLLAGLASASLLGCADDNSSDSAQDVIGKANPAAVFCDEVGGSYDLDSGNCTLKDGTVVDAWEYYRENAEK